MALSSEWVVTPYNSRTPDSDGTTVPTSSDGERSLNTTDKDTDTQQQKHNNDHDHRVKHLRKTRKQQMTALYNNKSDTALTSIPRSTFLSHAFPTDARERQKIKEKERKEQGIEPVKQIKHVEEH